MLSDNWRKAEVIALILAVFSLVTFLVVLQSDQAKCMANPLVYGAKHLSAQNAPAEFSCVCGFSNDASAYIEVNKTGWYISNAFQAFKN